MRLGRPQRHAHREKNNPASVLAGKSANHKVTAEPFQQKVRIFLKPTQVRTIKYYIQPAWHWYFHLTLKINPQKLSKRIIKYQNDIGIFSFLLKKNPYKLNKSSNY